MKPLAYGIDFGTTNSVLAVAWENRIEVMPGFPAPLLRSAVYLDRGGTRTAGEDAIRQFLARPDLQLSRLFMELKAALADERLGRLDLFDLDHRLESVVAVVFRYLKLVGDRHTGHDVRRLVLGFPVAFPDADGARFEERQSLALDRLCEAANLAGFEDIVPLEEPAAAASEETAELFAALDFGGGTFDVAVVRGDDHAAEVLALTGTPVGGERLTALLFEDKVTSAVGLDHPRLPNRYRVFTRSLPNVLAALFADDLSVSVMRECAPLYAAIMEGGFLYDLYAAVETTKIELSEMDSSSISLRRRGVDLDVTVQRDEFERAIEASMKRVFDEIDRALEVSGLRAEDLELVTLTGGSSRIPAFKRGVEERFPDAVIADRDPYGLVARGLAAQAQGVDW